MGKLDPRYGLRGYKRQVAVTHSAHASTVVLAVYNIRSLQAKNFLFMSNSVQAYMTPSLYLSTHIFIKNRMILEYKVTLFVLIILSETYIVGAVFVIICS